MDTHGGSHAEISASQYGKVRVWLILSAFFEAGEFGHLKCNMIPHPGISDPVDEGYRYEVAKFLSNLTADIILCLTIDILFQCIWERKSESQ